MKTPSVMASHRCGCQDGRVTLYTGHGKVITFCHCTRGLHAAEEKLRADLLVAFHETGRKP